MNKTVLFSSMSLLTVSLASHAAPSISDRPLRTIKLGAQLTVPYEARDWHDGMAFQGGRATSLSEIDLSLPYCQFEFSLGIFPEDVANYVLTLSEMEGAYVEGLGTPNFRTTLNFSAVAAPTVHFTCTKKATQPQFNEMTIGEFESVFGSLASWSDASFSSLPTSAINPDFSLQPQRLHSDISVKVDRDLVFDLVNTSREISIQDGAVVREIDFDRPFCKLVHESATPYTLRKDERLVPADNSVIGSYHQDRIGLNGFTTSFNFDEGRGLLQCDSGTLSPLTYGQMGQITRNLLIWTIHI